MNIIKILLTSIFLICLCDLFVYGQRKEINQQAFLSAYNQMVEKTDKFSQTVTFTGETFVTDIPNLNGKPQKIVVEFVPPYKIHLISTTWITKEIPSINEKIIVNGSEYEKEDGEWIKKEIPEEVIGAFRDKGFEKDVKGVNWYITENALLNNQTADLYESTAELKYQYPESKSNQLKEYTKFFKQKFWITKDNLLLKSETNQNDSRTGAMNVHIVFIYEYNQNIKIEAPIK